MMINFFEKNYKLSALITFLIASLIFYISSLTFKGVAYATNNNSIIYHFFAFFLFALFLNISSLRGDKDYRIFILVVTISILYSVSDELHQYFVPGRISSINDVIVDSFGIIFASLTYLTRIVYKS